MQALGTKESGKEEKSRKKPEWKKKVLTNGGSCGKIPTVRQVPKTVPCKLNND